MKTYAIVNRLDQHTYTLLTKAGVKFREHIFFMNNIREMLEVLEIKDKVVVVSIGTFINTSNLVWILNVLIAKQVSFTSLNERIRFSSTNPIKQAYKQHIIFVLNYEKRLLNDVEHIYKYQDRTEIIKRINMFSIGLIVDALKNDGILQK